MLASLTLTSESRDRDTERGARIRYLWNNDPVPQILSQVTEPRLDDAEHDRPERLDADFAYGYGRTFASSARDAAVIHSDAFDSTIRTEDTEPWAQADRYDTFGTPEFHPDHQRPERGQSAPELPRFGYRGELALGPRVYLRARTYDTELGRFTTPDPIASQPSQQAAVSPYIYASNDPLSNTDPLGLFSFGSVFKDVVHAVSHVAHGIHHALHAVTGAVTRGADILAGASPQGCRPHRSRCP